MSDDVAAEIKAARRQRREDDKVLALAPLCQHCGVGADLPARQHGPTCKLRAEQNAPWTPPPDAVMTLPGIDVPQPETTRVAAESAGPTKALSLEQIEAQCSPAIVPDVMGDAQIDIRVKAKPGLKFNLVIE